MNNRKSVRPALLVGFVLLVAYCAAAWLAPGTFFPFGSNRMHVLPDHTPALVHDSKLVKHADADARIRFVVALKLRDEADLDALLDEQSDPASPRYRQYLTAEQFRERFSPRTTDVDRVVAYLTGHGMSILEVSENYTLIHVEASVSQIEKAFSVQMNRYSTVRRADGRLVEYLGNAGDPSVPVTLESTVQAIIGLNTYIEFESRVRHPRGPANPGSKATPRGMTPQDVARVYDYPNANNDRAAAPLSGAGRTIAIATAHVYDQTDIDTFWQQFGIVRTGKLTNVYIGGVSTTVNEETTLDLEAASSQAPGADIIMYMAVDPKFVNFTLAFNKIVTDDKADVMSISWGLCEDFTGSRQMKAEHNIFKQAASQGMAVFAASGDDGAYDCPTEPELDDNGKPKTPPLAVDYPSSDPYVTAVGGTTLFDGQGRRFSESAWHGSGGGFSGKWKRPSWQTGPGVPTGKYRATADVALNADPMTGYAIYVDGKWIVLGGTSVAAPKWAALWTLIDEAAGKRIGMPDEILYRAGASPEYGTIFYDITSGDNGDYRGPGYNAGPNWDHPTGWGVPQGQALKDWIVKDLAPKPRGN